MFLTGLETKKAARTRMRNGQANRVKGHPMAADIVAPTNEVKYTPGPWKCNSVGDIETPTGNVATVKLRVGADGNLDYARQLANARLIAAAPDLLAACVEALCWLKVGKPINNGAKCETHGQMVDMVEAAIAKATVQS